MPATKRLVLYLPENVVQIIEPWVSSGRYADASEAVTSALLDRPPASDDWTASPAYRDWLAEGDELVVRAKRGEETFTPMDEVFDRVEAKLAVQIEAEDRAARRSAGGDTTSSSRRARRPIFPSFRTTLERGPGCARRSTTSDGCGASASGWNTRLSVARRGRTSRVSSALRAGSPCGS